MRFLLLFIIGFVVSSCAIQSHSITLRASAPTATPSASSVGEGSTISLQVLDDRASSVVGQRGPRMSGADLTAPNLIATIKEDLVSGFEARGFNVVSEDGTADTRVEARVRSFQFFLQENVLTVAENYEIAISIEAERGSDDYDRTYRSSNENLDRLATPYGSEIDQAMNAALSEVYRQIFNDEKLLGFLARPNF